jgi:hypothetical protein
MKTFAVERSLKGISMEDLGAAQRAAIAKAAEMTREGTPVSYMHSVHMPGDGRTMCLFQAEDAAAVERCNREAGIPFDRVSEAMHLPPAD